ncbi:MAG: divergent polysaccharide deacetylase family protein [Acidiferrobacterales bacterium]
MHRAAVALAALVLLGHVQSGVARDTGDAPASAIAIIIDDLGNNLAEGERTVRLPGPVACAILPQTPYARRLAGNAREYNKEVILHLPMESIESDALGPGGLDSKMRAFDIIVTLNKDLQTVPFAVGISNHMGSLLTQRRQPMEWLMQAITNRGGLFFVDSRTTPQTVAATVAREVELPHLARDVFLDNDQQLSSISTQFEILLDTAREHGSALALGHPYPETLAFLERKLPELENSGVRLVTLSKLLRMRNAKPASLRTSVIVRIVRGDSKSAN